MAFLYRWMAISLLGLFNVQAAHLTLAFVASQNQHRATHTFACNEKPLFEKNGILRASSSSTSTSDASSWGVGENWNSLSTEGANSSPSLSSLSREEINDPIGHAVKHLEREERRRINEEQGGLIPVKDEIDNAVEDIQLFYGDPNDPPLYDTEESLKHFASSSKFISSAEHEISMLVRCNESPDRLLEGEGRTLIPLTKEERQDVTQLIHMSFDALTGATKLNITPFFTQAVEILFQEHANSSTKKDGALSMDRKGVANWMTKSLGSEGKVSQHDKRVLAVMSKYSQYGSGQLTLDGFTQLYKEATLAGLDEDGNKKRVALGKRNALDDVWRDLEAHGIVSPRQQRWNEEMDHIRSLHPADSTVDSTTTTSTGTGDEMLLDECEILEWKKDSAMPDPTIDSHGALNQRRMSHETVDLCMDGKTPKSLKDGQFIFIDEESCIGCNQCATISPSSFIMLDTGRARTFHQRNTKDVDTAVAACPVSCMKRVAFHELTELETVRDKGDGRTDHRHMGGNIAHTPLHVAQRGTDANHKSSWYHYLKSKCLMSNQCPKRGCYDCPFYSEPGANPYFKKRQAEAYKARLAHIMSTGEADKHRRFAEL